MRIAVNYSKLITALWRNDINGNGYFLVSDGENKRKVKTQNNREGAIKAMLEFTQKVWNQTPTSGTMVNITRGKDKFLGYAFICEF